MSYTRISPVFSYSCQIKPKFCLTSSKLLVEEASHAGSMLPARLYPISDIRGGGYWKSRNLDITNDGNKMLLLTLSSLGFFEHSQPGGGGGLGADSAPPPPPHRNFSIINANQMKLCTFYILVVKFFRNMSWRHSDVINLIFKVISVIWDSWTYLHKRPIQLTLFC